MKTMRGLLQHVGEYEITVTIRPLNPKYSGITGGQVSGCGSASAFVTFARTDVPSAQETIDEMLEG